ncbi:hypothetical protein SLE2022_386580 [Rubroshorea leprosula]
MKSESAKGKRKLRNPEANSEETTEASPSDYSFAITRIAVAQVCKSMGFRRTEQSALDTLTVVTTKYLETLARSAADFSNAANRTQSNLFDVTNALHDLHAVHGGFLGASALHDSNCLLKSSVLKDLSDFVYSTDEIPFAKPINKEKGRGTEATTPPNSERRPKHIPEWLPGFPEMVGREECNKRVNQEELWENTSWAPVCEGGGSVGGRNNDNGGKLMTERARVSFRIGGGKRVDLNGNIGESPDRRKVGDDDDDKICTFLQMLILKRKKKRQRLQKTQEK